jgi:cell division protein FtsB
MYNSSRYYEPVPISNFDIIKFFNDELNFNMSILQIIILFSGFLIVVCCIPISQYNNIISNLSQKIEELEQNKNDVEDLTEENNDLRSYIQKMENQNNLLESENEFLVNRLKKLEEKNIILSSSLEEFITKKYSHPYNLRKKERVNYKPQLNMTSVEKTNNSDADDTADLEELELE